MVSFLDFPRDRSGFLLSRPGSGGAQLLVGLLMATLYLGFLGSRSLWVPDEGRYAEIAREMLVSGDLVTPRLDTAKYFEKPPLGYWTTAASLALMGRAEWACRLPTAIEGLLTLALVGWIGLRLAGPRVGLLAVLVLGTAPLHYGCAQFLVLDMGLCFFITAAIVTTLAAEQAVGPPWLWELSALALALGTLQKGPVAVVLWALVVVPYLLLSGGWRGFGGGRTRLIRCTALFVGITTPWFVIVQLRNPEFFRFFFIHEHLERFLTEVHFRGGPPYYFIAVALAGFFPWSMIVPAIALGQPTSTRKAGLLAMLWLGLPVLIACQARAGSARLIGAATALWIALPGLMAPMAGRHRTLALIAALWVMGPMAFFSVSHSKLPPYVLPAWPGLALLAAIAWDWMLDGVDREQSRTLAVMLVAAAIILALVGVETPRLFKPDAYPDLVAILPSLVALLELAAVTLVATAVVAWRGSVRPAFLAMLTVAVLSLVGGQLLARVYEPEKDVRVLARKLQSVRRPGERVIIYGPLESASGLPYYLDEPVPISGFIWGELDFAHSLDEPRARGIFLTYQQVFDLMRPTSPRAYFLTNPATFGDLRSIPQLRLTAVARRGDLVLFTNRE